MILSRCLLGFLMALVAMTPVSAAQAISPQSAEASQEQLLLTPPPGWHQAYNGRDGTMDLTLYTPAGQSAAAWNEALVIRVHHNLTTMPPDVFLSTVPAQIEETCHGLRAGKPQPGRINGYAAAFQFLECPLNRVNNQGEVVLSLAIQGQKALYVVQRAWQTSAFADSDKSPVPQPTLDTSVEHLRSVRLCNPSVPTAHPCR